MHLHSLATELEVLGQTIARLCGLEVLARIVALLLSSTTT
jgi:hypothetical protein